MSQRADREVDSNDSPKVPDRGRHQKHPAFLWALFFTGFGENEVKIEPEMWKLVG